MDAPTQTPDSSQTQQARSMQRIVRRPKAPRDRKDKPEMVLDQAEKLRGDEIVQAWFRLCRELDMMTQPEARMPRFKALLHANFTP